MGISIDWSVSLGNILTMVGFVVGGLSFVFAVRNDVSILATRLTPLEQAVTKMVMILEQVSRQDERLKAVERDIERNDPRKHWRQPHPG